MLLCAKVNSRIGRDVTTSSSSKCGRSNYGVARAVTVKVEFKASELFFFLFVYGVTGIFFIDTLLCCGVSVFVLCHRLLQFLLRIGLLDSMNSLQKFILAYTSW